MLSSMQRNKVSATLRTLKTKDWCESPDIDFDRKRKGMLIMSNGLTFFMHIGQFDNLGIAMLATELETLVTDPEAPNFKELKRMKGDEIVPDAEEKSKPVFAKDDRDLDFPDEDPVDEKTSEPSEDDSEDDLDFLDELADED